MLLALRFYQKNGPRRYDICPSRPFYVRNEALCFNVAIQFHRGGGGGGLYAATLKLKWITAESFLSSLPYICSPTFHLPEVTIISILFLHSCQVTVSSSLPSLLHCLLQAVLISYVKLVMVL